MPPNYSSPHRWRPAILLVGAVLSQLITAQDSQCYWRSQNAIGPVSYPGWFPCNNTQVSPGGAQLCCLQNAQCGSDGLCRQAASGGYNYFVGGCTDPNYNDPICRQSCTSDAQTWITWDSSPGVWHCCGDNGRNSCGKPTSSETFIADPPDRFVAVPSAPTSVSTASSTTAPTSAPTSLPSTSSTSTLTSSTPSSTSSPSSSGLSGGAIAGIAVGAAVVVLGILGAIAFFFWKKRRNSKQPEAQPLGPDTNWQQEHEKRTSQMQQSEAYGAYKHQSSGYHSPPPQQPLSPQEMPVGDRSELGGDERR